VKRKQKKAHKELPKEAVLTVLEEVNSYIESAIHEIPNEMFDNNSPYGKSLSELRSKLFEAQVEYLEDLKGTIEDALQEEQDAA